MAVCRMRLSANFAEFRQYSRPRPYGWKRNNSRGTGGPPVLVECCEGSLNSSDFVRAAEAAACAACPGISKGKMRFSLKLITIVLVIPSFAASQEVERFNVSMNAAGVFSKTSNSSNGSLTLKPTNSVAQFGTFRWRLNRFHALELNIGYTMNSQVYTLAPNNFRVATGI